MVIKQLQGRSHSRLMLKFCFSRLNPASFKRYKTVRSTTIRDVEVNELKEKHGDKPKEQILKALEEEFNSFAKQANPTASVFNRFKEDLKWLEDHGDGQIDQLNRKAQHNKVMQQKIENTTKEEAIEMGKSIFRKSWTEWVPTNEDFEETPYHRHVVQASSSRLRQKNPDAEKESRSLSSRLENLKAELQGLTPDHPRRNKTIDQRKYEALQTQREQFFQATGREMTRQSLKPTDIGFNLTGDEKRESHFEELFEEEEKPQKLSSRAREKIYEMYLEGWTIREISHRFGIMPCRAKAVIWLRSQFWAEVFPRFGVGYLHNVDKLQRNLCEEEQTEVEYGLDLEVMQEVNQGIRITRWSTKLIDEARARDPELRQMKEEAEQKIGRKKLGVRHTLLTLGVKGRGKRAFVLKDWLHLRGMGSDDFILQRCLFRQMLERERRFGQWC